MIARSSRRSGHMSDRSLAAGGATVVDFRTTCHISIFFARTEKRNPYSCERYEFLFSVPQFYAFGNRVGRCLAEVTGRTYVRKVGTVEDVVGDGFSIVPTGRTACSCHRNPAMNRWATFECPSGAKTQGSTATCVEQRGRKPWDIDNSGIVSPEGAAESWSPRFCRPYGALARAFRTSPQG